MFSWFCQGAESPFRLELDLFVLKRSTQIHARFFDALTRSLNTFVHFVHLVQRAREREGPNETDFLKIQCTQIRKRLVSYQVLKVKHSFPFKALCSSEIQVTVPNLSKENFDLGRLEATTLD